MKKCTLYTADSKNKLGECPETHPIYREGNCYRPCNPIFRIVKG